MHRHLIKKIKSSFRNSQTVKRKYRDINPEDIFLDSTNLPGFDEHSLEGRIEKPMSHTTFFALKIFLAILVIGLGTKLWILGVKDGEVYAQISDQNRLEQTLIFANRGIILDRNGVELATNDIKSEENEFAGRLYAPIKGLAHVVGYVKYPMRDKAGFYYEKEYRPRDGAERAYDDVLSGKNGTKLVETDVMGKITSESIISKPVDGETLTLSIDARVNEVLHNALATLADRQGFVG